MTYVSIQRGYQSARPCINGTRLTVDAIVSFFEHGKTMSETMLAYPDFTADDFRHAIWIHYVTLHPFRKQSPPLKAWLDDYAVRGKRAGDPPLSALKARG